MSPGRVAAFFDFDGTIIDGYSAKAVLVDRLRRGRMGAGSLGRLGAALVAAAAGRDPLEEYLRAEVAALAGVEVSELDALGRRLARSAIGGWLFQEAAEIIDAHRRAGHLLVIVSSALSFQVEYLAAELGFDRVLCTRPEAVDGVCTGRLQGPVLWGPEKDRAVRVLAAAEQVDLQASYAYANGDEDVQFLSAVGHPVAVNPAPGLEETAKVDGWDIRRFARRDRPGVLDGVRTVAAYGGLGAGVGLGAALGALNRSRRQGANVAFSVGSDLGLSLAGVRINVAGGQNLWAARPAVFIFNHQSLLDGWVAINLLRRDFTGVAKKEIGRVPLLAQFAWLTNVALVDRSDSAAARAALDPVLERLKAGYSITLAPEGTRSVTPRLGPFKKGAFHLAMQAGVPVVPMVIRNAGELQWRGSRAIRPGVIDVAVLEPISVSDWTADDLTDRVDRVRNRFVEALADWDVTVASLGGAPQVTT